MEDRFKLNYLPEKINVMRGTDQRSDMWSTHLVPWSGSDPGTDIYNFLQTLDEYLSFYSRALLFALSEHKIAWFPKKRRGLGPTKKKKKLRSLKKRRSIPWHRNRTRDDFFKEIQEDCVFQKCTATTAPRSHKVATQWCFAECMCTPSATLHLFCNIRHLRARLENWWKIARTASVAGIYA